MRNSKKTSKVFRMLISMIFLKKSSGFLDTFKIKISLKGSIRMHFLRDF